MRSIFHIFHGTEAHFGTEAPNVRNDRRGTRRKATMTPTEEDDPKAKP